MSTDPKPKLKFVDGTKNQQLLAQSLSIIRGEQIDNPLIRMALSSDGEEFCPIEGRRENEAVYLYALFEELEEPGALEICGIAISYLHVIKKQARLFILVPSKSRRKGYGKLLAALVTYWLFTVQGAQVVYGTTPASNLPASKIGASLLKEVGQMPNDWLWRGTWVSSNTYALSIADLLVDSYSPIEKIIKSFSVSGVDLVPLSKFEKLHAKEG